MLIQKYTLKNIYIYQIKTICTYIYTIHVWTWLYDLQMDLYVCVSIFAQWLHQSWKLKKKKKKNGLQSNDINHNTNLESDSKHQYNPATPTGDNVKPIGPTNLENTNKRVFGLHDECEWQYTIVQYHTQKLNHQICALGRTTDMTCSV